MEYASIQPPPLSIRSVAPAPPPTHAPKPPTCGIKSSDIKATSIHTCTSVYVCLPFYKYTHMCALIDR